MSEDPKPPGSANWLIFWSLAAFVVLAIGLGAMFVLKIPPFGG